MEPEYFPPSFVKVSDHRVFDRVCEALTLRAEDHQRTPQDKKKHREGRKQELQDQLQILRGQIRAGNDNSDLREDVDSITRELWDLNGISRNEYNEWRDHLKRPLPPRRRQESQQRMEPRGGSDRARRSSGSMESATGLAKSLGRMRVGK
jgi:hypothetical protein